MRMLNARVLVAIALMFGVASPAWSQLAARPAEEWITLLDSPARIAGLQVDTILGRLHLKAGEVVADLGAGTGVFSVPMARAVGPAGKVYAVDIDQKLVDYIANKTRQQDTPNVRTILGKFGDPGLPAADVDLAFMHDVLHHVQDRAGYLSQVVKYLKPGARIVIVEPDAQKGSHRDDPKLQVTKEQLQKWMADLGFRPSDHVDLSPEKWFVAYSRTAAR